jgi:hypothetical protein
MKFKMFSGDCSDVIVRDVNQWLSEEAALVTIRHTETKLTFLDSKMGADIKTGAAALLFSVWYDEDVP